MTVHLDWPADLVDRLNKEARERGLSLDAYVLEKVLRPESSRAANAATMPPLRPYQKRWIGKEGAAFRQDLYDRQRKRGSDPLVDNPTIDEIKSCIRKHAPKRVLEVGCGWGRLLEDLVSDFDAYGCDISSDLLARTDQQLSSKLLTIDIDVPRHVRCAFYARSGAGTHG
jgi:SAM-dependent methyltransferase